MSESCVLNQRAFGAVQYNGLVVPDYVLLLILHLSINIVSHHPPPGQYRGKEGYLPCFDTETCPISGEFDSNQYAQKVV